MANGENKPSIKLAKNLKHKKVPQRGMGVAQLEKIMFEQQELKDVVVLSSNSNKNRRPGIPLPPNRHPMVSKSSQNQNNPYLNVMPTDQVWQQIHAQRSQFQQPTSSSMVNVSQGSAVSSTSASVMNTRIEPPSIQNFRAKSYPSFQPDGDKMAGSNRPNPFLRENTPVSSFSRNIPSAFKSTASLELKNSFSRDKPSTLVSKRDQKNNKNIVENRYVTRDFFTLAPPKSSPPSHSKLNKLLPFSVGELTQPCVQDQTRDSEGSKQPQPLHSFFPAAKFHAGSNGEAGSNVEAGSNDEAGEHVDLSLKL